MKLLLSDRDVAERQRVASTALAPLAVSLAADLRAVIDRPLYVPEQKALLSREGGRCPDDGTMLDFDPFSPHEHRCPKCGKVFGGELHHRFWIYWYQLWLAERAVHGALLGALGVESRGAAFAASVLEIYAERYLAYPNVDNVLGPTRPFFSTYLESIWLLQLCIALDLLGGSGKLRGHVIDRVIEPSCALIALFDEGMSNRQVWNNAALMAAARIRGRDDDLDAPIWGESGLAMHLSDALLPDGTWYEGENYHLFAHRGLWYGVVLAEHAGIELPPELVRRFEAAFASPFLSALPDFTLPSRRDSQYAISLRQWRFAEMCELGLARRDDRILSGALSRMYADDLATGNTGRWASAGDVERNLPATHLTRSDLGWKSLLFARPAIELPKIAAAPSVLLESQGIGIIRRDMGQVYVALDYGHSGGGHGHPDRLNLLLMDGQTRWLDDYGTGSYVDPSLHWYRSTLAHNAPMLGMRTQRQVDGHLLGYEDRGAAGWISAMAQIDGMAGASRHLFVMTDYMVDTVGWTASAGQGFSLPLHVDARAEDESPVILSEAKNLGLNDGFPYVRDVERIASARANEPLKLTARKDGKTLDLWLGSDSAFEVLRMVGPAAPGHGDAAFMLVRSPFANGSLQILWSWRGTVKNVSFNPTVITTQTERHELVGDQNTSSVVIHSAGARSSIDFVRPRPVVRGMVEEVHETFAHPLDRGNGVDVDDTLGVDLGEESYVRSEQSWSEAGRPRAHVTLGARPRSLTITIEVENVDRTFVAPGTVNTLDNEPADINGAGVQLYLRSRATTAGYVIVPIADSERVNIRPIAGWGSAIPIDARWSPLPRGYGIDVEATALDGEIELDLVINERPEGRERRRGQLVLSGGGGFVYLRGDRHEPSRLISIQLPDA